MDILSFTQRPAMVLATNTFIDVPIVLQFETTPLIQFVREESAGYTTEVAIYHSDGTYLARARGSQLYLTEAGRKAGVTLDHPNKATVCKLGEQVLFEMRRDDAAAIKTRAELYAPEGYFLKCTNSPEPQLFDVSGNALRIGSNITVEGNIITACGIGILVTRNSFAVGVG